MTDGLSVMKPACPQHDCYVRRSMIYFSNAEDIIMPKPMTKEDLDKLRQQYIKNPPEGMTAREIKSMSDEDLLDMDYYLHDEDDGDDLGEEGFYLF